MNTRAFNQVFSISQHRTIEAGNTILERGFQKRCDCDRTQVIVVALKK